MERETCLECGKGLKGTLPYVCKWCGKSFCIKHRRPEDHYCPEFYSGKTPKITKRRKKWYEFWKR